MFGQLTSDSVLSFSSVSLLFPSKELNYITMFTIEPGLILPPYLTFKLSRGFSQKSN